MENLGGAVEFARQHQLELLLVGSAVVNALLALHRPEKLVAALERSPRAAALLALLRAVGIDPVGAIRAVQGLLAAKAAEAAAGAVASKGGGE